MSSYSKRNYELTTRVIGRTMRAVDQTQVPSQRVEQLRGITRIIHAFVVDFQEDNPRFDEGKFIAAIEDVRNGRV